MNMKPKFLLAPALVMISSAALWGQATKVALINMQQAISTTKDGQARIAELQKKYGPKQQDFQRREQDIQTKEDELKKTQNTISDSARSNLESDIAKLKTNLQRDVDDAKSDSDQDQQKLMQDVGNKVYQTVTKYAQENQIMLVFDLSGQPNNLICCASAPDITREVIALYDKTNSPGAASAAPGPRPPAAKPAGAAATPRSTGATTGK